MPQRIAWVLPPSESGQVSQAKEQIRQLANDDHLTWVLCSKQTRSEVAHHLQVYPVEGPTTGFGLWTLWELLTRKKKYDRILFPKPHPLVGWLQQLSFIHKAQVEILECP